MRAHDFISTFQTRGQTAMLIPNAWKLQAPAKCYASGTTCVSTGPRARSRAPERHCTRSGRKLRALNSEWSQDLSQFDSLF